MSMKEINQNIKVVNQTLDDVQVSLNKLLVQCPIERRRMLNNNGYCPAFETKVTADIETKSF